MTRLVALLSFLLLACQPQKQIVSPVVEAQAITVEELLADPARYQGQTITVMGYLTHAYGPVSLMQMANRPCSDNYVDPMLATDIDIEKLKGVDNSKGEYWESYRLSGKRALISGIFLNKDQPLVYLGLRSPEFVVDDKEWVIGPLKDAKIVAVFDDVCYDRSRWK